MSTIQCIARLRGAAFRFLAATFIFSLPLGAAVTRADEPQPEPLYYGHYVPRKNLPVAYMYVNYGSYSLFCSGVLIQKNLLLTAAHCLDDGPVQQIYTVVGGVHVAYGVKYSLSRYLDLGAVRLGRRIPSSVKPAKQASGPPVRGEPMIIFGYGRDEFGGLGVLRTGWMQLAVDYGLWMLGLMPAGGSNTCKGDSGGPAFVLKKNQLRLVGITSAGSVDCRNGDTIFSSTQSAEAKQFLKFAKKM